MTSRLTQEARGFSLRRWLLAPPLCQDAEQLRAAVADRTVLITGASSGIGEATALLLGRAGAEVLLLGRRRDRLEALASTLKREGHRASVYPLDLSRSAEIAPLMAVIEAQHPRIDMVISNAGKSIRRPVLHASERHDLTRSLAVNFSGPAALMEALLPRMVAQGGGQLVNVSTVSARQPGAPRWASYQGSKAGFDVWFRSAGSELRGRHVTASSVYLPLVRTPMSAGTPMYAHVPALSAQEAALAVAQTLVSRDARSAPWWLFWTELAGLLWPRTIDRLLSWLDACLPAQRKR